MPVFSWTLPPFTAIPSPVPVDDSQRDLFGYDILFKNGTLPITGGGDYVRVGGDENLRAAIYRRLLTRPGEFRFRPSYGAGVGTFVKKQATQAVLDALSLRIVEQLTQDERLQKVEVVVEAATVNGVQVFKVLVKASVSGRTQTFAPLTFSEETT